MRVRLLVFAVAGAVSVLIAAAPARAEWNYWDDWNSPRWRVEPWPQQQVLRQNWYAPYYSPPRVYAPQPYYTPPGLYSGPPAALMYRGPPAALMYR